MSTRSPTLEIRGLRPKEKAMSKKENASGAQVPCISLSADSECGIGELLRRREAALREYMRLDELLYFAMKRKITEANSVNNTTSQISVKPTTNNTGETKCR